ncbi:TetR/AcrR family transcriptional regulator [Saccharibacillus sp. CPCC 101409]|uniref:TetR/AcrR family transcriptional regulator n=1 Tax=Saccharibacillus sp. CPCC 101409 TaxID=3058041 RepID=UPI00267256B0|nr:TetR/AcrR family transcriptional regulator [Saccharibacillus sp. CPCC 101409]MDO3408976.1 TetR/AcrR family transcriptional regulator [Saccharibacillus sp. CPCC 101409]
MSAAQSEKYEAILDAAFEIFGKKGFYDTKISEITEHAGIAKGTMYLYFKSKEELFAAVTERDWEQFMGDLLFRLKGADGLSDQLERIASHHLEYYYERKAHTKLFFRTPNNDPQLMTIMQRFLERYMQTVLDVLKDSGLPDADFYAKAYIGMLDRLKMDILFENGLTRKALEHRVTLTVRLFMHGCEPEMNG